MLESNHMGEMLQRYGNYEIELQSLSKLLGDLKVKAYT
jgi:hypothetical protein